jgi:lipoprotein-releasing system ATP-binding protein
MSELLRAEGLSKSYVSGDGRPIRVLDGLDLAVDAGEMVAVVGASGVGKSPLLHLLGGLDRPDGGTVRIGGEPVHPRSPSELARLRSRSVGFIFQFHHLLPEFDAVENVMMPLLIAREDPADARRQAVASLEALGLGERLSHRPSELSGGEQQRVAIARAIVRRPAVILADEPTGNLDPATGEAVFNSLVDLQSSYRFAAVIATHNEKLAMRCDRILQMGEGRLREVAWDEVQWAPRSREQG